MAANDDAAKGPRRDALLGAVRLLIWGAVVVSIALALAMALSVPLMPLWWEPLQAALEERARDPLPDNLQVLIGGSLLFAAVIGVVSFLFFRQLLLIVDTVGQGDPFIPDNAVRLRRMGWLAVIAQALALPASSVTGWIAHITHTGYIEGQLSLGGILLALILFVLARVFRRGAEMREELEGTV